MGNGKWEMENPQFSFIMVLYYNDNIGRAMGFWGTSTTENTDVSLQTNDCAQDASTQTTTTQDVNLRMEMDCSFSFTNMNIVGTTKCPDGSEVTSTEAMTVHADFETNCDQIANLNVQSDKDTEAGFTAACLQTSKNKTKQKATSVAGLSFPGTSASATNYKSSASAQRSAMVSSFYSMSSQRTSATMIMDAHQDISDSTMDTCALKVLLDHHSRVNAKQEVTINAGMVDKVSSAVDMQTKQFNSNVTDQTAVAKTGMSLWWIVVLLVIFVMVVLIGPGMGRMLLKASKGVYGAVKRGAKGIASGAKGMAGSAASSISAYATTKNTAAAVPPPAPGGFV
jgi:hypothetical protein